MKAIFCQRCGYSARREEWVRVFEYAGVVTARRLHAEAAIYKHRDCDYVAVCVYKAALMEVV